MICFRRSSLSNGVFCKQWTQLFHSFNARKRSARESQQSIIIKSLFNRAAPNEVIFFTLFRCAIQSFFSRTARARNLTHQNEKFCLRQQNKTLEKLNEKSAGHGDGSRRTKRRIKSVKHLVRIQSIKLVCAVVEATPSVKKRTQINNNCRSKWVCAVLCTLYVMLSHPTANWNSFAAN